jgi:arylesterase/paraoxonase
MRIDLNRTPYSAEPALTDGPQLHPHGISLFIDQAGLRHLFVINHPEDRASGDEVIELYVETTPGVFAHQESFASPLITRANDLVAVGPRQFYVAQDVDRTSNVTLTDLVYFDGTRYTVVANDIESGGGINVSADYATLYIAETGGKAIRVVAREADGSVTTLERIALGSSPDNIDVAADQSLWVGAHSNVTALAMHFIMGSNAPSQILRVERNEEGSDIREIYLNAGEQISAGSGGATYGNKLVIGSITARKVLVCEMD